MAAVAADVRTADRTPRWLLITLGVLWLLVSLVILSVDATSVASVGYLCGGVLIIGGIAEFGELAMDIGWKWLHAVLGVLFVLTGIGALMSPFQTFGVLALLVGWFLVFKGAADIAQSVAFRGVLPLWGLALASGIIEVALGVWAIGYPGRSSWLLLFWVGVGAMVRGVNALVAAFTRGDMA